MNLGHNTPMDKILVTGGTGFIGKELVSQLRKENNSQVYVLSRKNKGEFFIQGDLNDSKTISEISKHNFVKVFHLAWEGLPKRDEDLSSLNLKKSHYFLGELANIYPLAHFYVFGSCLEYGDITGPVLDDSVPTGDSFFAQAKIKLHQYIDELNINYTWYRPFYVYGQGQNSNSLIPYLINSCENKKEIKLNSYSNSHDFINVYDLVSAVIASSKSNITGNINLGTGRLTSVIEIVKTITEHFGLAFDVKESPQEGLFSNSDLLINSFSWRPEYIGVEGISKYYFNGKNSLLK
jgi:dTDP-6-deoxy-L-talose 4-dehydrogenase (NAD+)